MDTEKFFRLESNLSRIISNTNKAELYGLEWENLIEEGENASEELFSAYPNREICSVLYGYQAYTVVVEHFTGINADTKTTPMAVYGLSQRHRIHKKTLYQTYLERSDIYHNLDHTEIKITWSEFCFLAKLNPLMVSDNYFHLFYSGVNNALYVGHLP